RGRRRRGGPCYRCGLPALVFRPVRGSARSSSLLVAPGVSAGGVPSRCGGQLTGGHTCVITVPTCKGFVPFIDGACVTSALLRGIRRKNTNTGGGVGCVMVTGSRKPGRDSEAS